MSIMRKKKVPPYVWVVEVFYGTRWYPTAGAGIDKPSARDTLADWKRSFPDDKLRLTKYVRVKGEQ